MMRHFWISLCLLPLQALATHVDVLTIKGLDVQLSGFEANVCYLEPLEEIDKRINTRMTAANYNATSYMEPVYGPQTVHKSSDARLENGPQTVHTIGLQKGIIKEAEYAALCQQRAFQFEIKKLPAIVINEEYVTYGVRDVAKAIAECRIRGFCLA